MSQKVSDFINNDNLSFKTPKREANPLDLDKLRHYQVRTKNTLIQNTSFRLSTSQQKIILHLIQRINSKTENLRFRFNVRDYEDFLGIKPDSRNTTDIKKALQQLANKSFWVRTRKINKDHPDEEYDDLIRWFSMVRYNRTHDYFEVQFDDRLKPFLLNIKSSFTSFDYHNVIGMRKTYSIRLYEILVSHYNQQNRIYGYKYSVNQLRFLLGIKRGKYNRFSDLNRRVIKPSLIEMNKRTNFHFFYNKIKRGNKVIGIRVLLRRKSPHEIRETTNATDRKLLRNNKSYNMTKGFDVENDVKQQALKQHEAIVKKNLHHS